MDMSKQLQAYEVEYHVLQDELLDTPPTLNQHQRAAQLERTNQCLRQQNLDLLEELQVRTHIYTQVKCMLWSLLLCSFQPSLSPTQVSHARVSGLEGQVETLAQSESRLREQVSALEEEKKQLASTITHLQDLLTSLGIHTTPDGHTLPPPSKRHTVTAPAKVENMTVDSLLRPLALPEGS